MIEKKKTKEEIKRKCNLIVFNLNFLFNLFPLVDRQPTAVNKESDQRKQI